MKSSLTLILSFCFFLLQNQLVNSQSSWIKQADFGGSPRFAATNFTVNNHAYILGGIVDKGPFYEAYSEFWRYDPLIDVWILKGTFPAGKIFAASAFVIGDVAYILLGADQNGDHLQELYAFDGLTEVWTKKADFAGSGRNYAYTFTANGKGYVGGGVTFVASVPNYNNDLWEYDPATDKWTKEANFPSAGRVGMTSFSLDNKGYVGLGDDGAVYYTDFYQYDPTSNSWSAVATFNGQNRSFCQSVSAGNEGFVIGGERSHGVYTDEMWRYSALTDQWSPAYQFTGPPRAYANLFYLNQVFYYGLGLTGPNDTDAANDLYKFEDMTGIDHQVSEAEIRVFPNPANSGIFNISSNVPMTRLTVRDEVGRLLQVERVEEPETVLNLTSFSYGIYFLMIETSDDRFLTEKLIYSK